MSKSKKELEVVDELIINKIYLVRGQKVMLDSDLAELYGIETKALKRSIKRNSSRFPKDFMFQLTVEELNSLRYQFGTSKTGRGGAMYLPYVFTEQGVAMLSSVLNSEIAVQVNIQIIRIYTRMREMLLTRKDILLKLEQLERQALENAGDIQLIFEYLKELLIPEEQKNRKLIGFNRKD